MGTSPVPALSRGAEAQPRLCLPSIPHSSCPGARVLSSTYLVEPKVQGEGDDIARVSPAVDVPQLQLEVMPFPITELQLVQEEAGAAPGPPAHHEGEQAPSQLQKGNSNTSSEQRPHQLWLPPAYPPSEYGEGKPSLLEASPPNYPLLGMEPAGRTRSPCSPEADSSRGWAMVLWLRPWPYLAEQGGVLACVGLQQHPILLACPKCQPQVPRH